jgi:hypothetical protein
LKGVIKSVAERHHRRCIRSTRQTYPIPKLKPSEQSEADVLLEAITDKVSKEKVTDSRQQSWISDNTWKLIDQRIEARRKVQASLLTRKVRKGLNEYRRNRYEKVGIEIQSRLDKGDI